MRLIDADKLIKYLNDYALTEAPDDRECAGERRVSEAVYSAIHSCLKAVEEQPTAGWIPVDERLPDPDRYLLVSFENFSIPIAGRYTVDDEDSGTFRVGDDDETFLEHGLIVNAWMPLPEPYREEQGNG